MESGACVRWAPVSRLKRNGTRYRAAGRAWPYLMRLKSQDSSKSGWYHEMIAPFVP